MKNWKGFIIALTSIFLCLCSAEILFRQFYQFSKQHIEVITTPSGFIQSDSLLGWKLKDGAFKMYINDSSLRSDINIINSKRVVSKDRTKINKNNSIHFYGCSNTFGFNLNDSESQPFHLQSMLPNFIIENHAVPAYGLSQICLQMNNNFSEGKKPDIAVFNLARFHHFRSPLYPSWSIKLKFAISALDSKSHNLYSLPYFTLNEKEELISKICTFENLPKPLWGSTRLAFVNALNNFIVGFRDNKAEPQLDTIAHRIVEEISNACKQHHVIPVFAFYQNAFLPEIDDALLALLGTRGEHYFTYSIDYSLNKYNNCPYDCMHPNGAANKIFANDLLEYLASKNLINIK